MAAGRGAELLRPSSSAGRATFLELFFDLAFVVAGVLALVALLDMLRGRGAPLEPPAPPIGREATDVRDPEA
ncbi:hypothetical protein [Micromonospora sp. DT231]|uniref:hypothetical protein n=1 Tax=Micromonospora sp. DT231 TaxID=3416526 RepID=UPI003CF618DF